jgi:hypothetical protein
MAGTAEVEVKEGIIVATYRGEMTLDIVRKAGADIEEKLASSGAVKILYDTIEMENPAMKLALEMKSFDAKIKDKVEKSATVVPGAATALKASIAFVLSRRHKVFHNDMAAAVVWLKS